MKKRIQVLLILCFAYPLFAQNFLSQSFYENYHNYKEESILTKRVKHKEVLPLIYKLEGNEKFKVKTLGYSLQGRSINMISLGNGETDVLLWSQMHGDESTATMALFDIFNFFAASDNFDSFREKLLSNLTIHFIPMLNPDGAEVFKRRNALYIDLNRDAERLQFPESKILKSVRDSINPKFGFNLHDQSTRYTAGRAPKSATLSFLAPAYNYEKTINEVRANTMKVIVNLYDELSKFIPGHIGRYSDDFEPRAFGDNMVKWGTGSVLIESGGWKNDVEKQFIRKLNFIAILTALQSISEKYYELADINKYETIPENERLLFNTLFKNLIISYENNKYIIDVGVNLNEREKKDSSGYYFEGRIEEVGDLSIFYGYDELDCSGMEIKPGKVYPTEFNSIDEIHKLDFDNLLTEGFTFLKLNTDETTELEFNLPINVIVNNNEFESEFRLGSGANFIITENSEIRFTVVNGFIFDSRTRTNKIKNALIMK
ncbi:MAG: peptidase M14 [Ignavibacteriae bacterium]|nr:peptidase M14 [Ignavibacteriota bacterium]NOG98367.1 peptidase M14 [Ignavibacteriota bacterium]